MWLSHWNVVIHKPQPIIAIGDFMGSSYKGWFICKMFLCSWNAGFVGSEVFKSRYYLSCVGVSRGQRSHIFKLTLKAPNSCPNSTHLCALSICHVRRCSSPSAFAPQGPRLGGPSTHGEPLWQYGTISMTTQKPSKWRPNWRFGLIFMRDHPKLGLDWSSGTSHTINVHVFLEIWVSNACLESSEWPMDLIKSKTLRGLYLPSRTPSLHLVWGVCQNLTKFLSFWPNLVLNPLNFGTFCSVRSPTSLKGLNDNYGCHWALKG